MRVQTIRFDDRRRPRPRDKIVLGFEGDNMVERLEFILPVIADVQTAQLMMGGKYANAVLLQRDDEAYYADLTAEIVGTDGEVEAYVQINGSGGEAWHSDVMRLITGALPDVDREIETRYPTAVETMLAEIAGHRAEMGETLGEAQAAADRAEDAAVNPPIIGDNGHWLLWDFEAGRYIDSGVAAQGPPGQAYTLPPATPDTLGGMMPGDGLTVDEYGRASVEPGNKYELIELITLGYERLTEKPDDWETNKTAYFWLQDKTIAPVTTQDWSDGDLFFRLVDYEGVNGLIRNVMPDGTPYNLERVFIRVYTPANPQLSSSSSINYSFGNRLVMTLAHLANHDRYGAVRAWIENGYMMADGGDTTGKWSSMISSVPAHYRWMHPADTITEINIQVPGTRETMLLRGSIFEIWGVSAK